MTDLARDTHELQPSKQKEKAAISLFFLSLSLSLSLSLCLLVLFVLGSRLKTSIYEKGL